MTVTLFTTGYFHGWYGWRERDTSFITTLENIDDTITVRMIAALECSERVIRLQVL